MKDTQDSRFRKKQKQRKTLLLNVLLGVVLLAAITVAFQVFTSDSSQTAAEPTVKEEKAIKEKTSTAEENRESAEGEEATDSSSSSEETDTSDSGEEASPESETETGTIELPDQPSDASQDSTQPSAGTVHQTNFDSNSQDWQDMLQAISGAVQIPVENMTVWHLGNGGPNKAIGTVQSKDKQNPVKYKVYIEWVEGAGWKPTSVEQLQ